jgi:hypothetical protein
LTSTIVAAAKARFSHAARENAKTMPVIAASAATSVSICRRRVCPPSARRSSEIAAAGTRKAPKTFGSLKNACARCASNSSAVDPGNGTCRARTASSDVTAATAM